MCLVKGRALDCRDGGRLARRDCGQLVRRDGGLLWGILIFSALFNLQCTCRRKLPWKLACKCTEDSKVHRRLPNCTEDMFGDEGHPGIEGLSGTPGSVASPESSETYNVLSPASGTPAVASS